MRTKKLQIALEFMLVFTFVMTIFIILFAIISSRASLLFNQQVFSQVSYVAQQVAQQLNIALNSGSGYSANILLQSGYGINPYNITLLNSGEIIVAAQQAGQRIQSIAFSQARNVYAGNLINTGSMRLQNFFGLICVDAACPAPSNYSSGTSLSTQVVHAARFNGASSYMTANAPQINTAGGGYNTVSFWVYWTGTNGQMPFGFFTWPGGSPGYGLLYESASCFGFDTLNSDVYGINPSNSIGRWTYVTAVFYNGAYTGNNKLYINGKQQSLAQCFGSASSGTATTTLQLSGQTGTSNYYFGGSVADLQIYNTALSAAQANTLYQEGISGSPVISSNVVGWWPLNGNPYDYSGNNNTGTPHNIVFPTVAELAVKAANARGSGINNTLVGFASSLGSFARSPFASNLTNSNGMATAFLNQNLTGGPALVAFAAYPGSLGEQKNLSAWWPLTPGFMNLTPVHGIVSWWPLNGNANDYSGKNSGTATNVIYSQGNTLPSSFSVADFNGQSSYISTGANSLPVGSSPRSVFAWVYLNGNNLANDYNIFSYGTAATAEQARLSISSTCGSSLCASFEGNGDNFYSTMKATRGTWHFIGYTYGAGSSQVTVYLDGQSQTGSLSQALNTVIPSSDPSDIGKASGGVSASVYLFNGSIASVQVYNTALTPLQAAQLYSEEIQGQPVGFTAANAYDISGYNDTGAAANIVYSNTGAVFSGTNDFISASANSLPIGSAARSVFAWFYFTGNTLSTPYGYAISYYGVPSTAETSMLSVHGGRLDFVGYGDNFNSTLNVTQNAWYFAGYSYAAAANTITLYLNGQSQTGSLSANTPLNTVVSSTAANGDHVIGSFGLGSSWNFTGTIADVQIYKSALTPVQAWQLYASGQPPTTNVTIPLSLLSSKPV